MACHSCNQDKGNQTAAEFGKPELEAEGKKHLSLQDAAAVNSTRKALYHGLESLGLPLEEGTGGRTKWNRTQRGLPKEHWIDAACVGASTPAILSVAGIQPLLILAMGYGHRRICTTNKYGFPKAYRARIKSFMGFQTGDMVRAIIPSGKHMGTHVGRVTIRSRPSFKLNGFDVHPKYLTLLQRHDGYAYAL